MKYSTNGVMNIDKASQIQKYRYESGLRGYSKAVRRYFQRFHADDYRKQMKKLPVKF